MNLMLNNPSVLKERRTPVYALKDCYHFPIDDGVACLVQACQEIQKNLCQDSWSRCTEDAEHRTSLLMFTSQVRHGMREKLSSLNLFKMDKFMSISSKIPCNN